MPASFTGGVFIAAGDVNGDGKADIIASADKGGSPQVSVYDGPTQALRASFYALPATFTGGVRIGFAPSFHGRPAILATAGPGGAPPTTVYDAASLAILDSFFVFPADFTGGAFVAGK